MPCHSMCYLLAVSISNYVITILFVVAVPWLQFGCLSVYLLLLLLLAGSCKSHTKGVAPKLQEMVCGASIPITGYQSVVGGGGVVVRRLRRVEY